MILLFNEQGVFEKIANKSKNKTEKLLEAYCVGLMTSRGGFSDLPLKVLPDPFSNAPSEKTHLLRSENYPLQDLPQILSAMPFFAANPKTIAKVFATLFSF